MCVRQPERSLLCDGRRTRPRRPSLPSSTRRRRWAVQLSRRQIIAYAAVAVVVVAVGVRYVVLPRSAGPSESQAVVLAPVASPSAAAGGTEAGGGGYSSAAAVSPSPSASPDVVVYVCGAVRSPGVVRLPAGARVTDALEIAGGPTAKAELAAVNLAAPVTDGQQIVVPEKGAAGAVTVAPAGGASGGPAAAGAAATPGRHRSTSTRRRSRSWTRSTGSGRPRRRRSSTTAPSTAASRRSTRSRRSRASATPSSPP